MTEAELDYKKMFEALSQQFEKYMKQEEEYFQLLTKISELTPYETLAVNHATKMKMSDQLKLLRVIVRACEISKTLCEKYNLEEITEELVEEAN